MKTKKGDNLTTKSTQKSPKEKEVEANVKFFLKQIELPIMECSR